MGDAASELSGKLGLDTTDFKTAIAAANRELRVIESGFRASAAALGDWANDASGLETRIESLTKAIDVQKGKVAALQEEYNRIAAEQGASSRAAQDMQIRLNKETESLNKMERELNESTAALGEMASQSDKAGDEVGDLDAQQQKAARSAETLKSVMGGLGTAMKAGAVAIAAVGAAAVAAAAGIGRMVLGAAETAGELVDMSNKTGISVERLQELSYIGDQVGVSTETITGALARMTRQMSAAQGGNEAANEAFAKLGVSVTDANGSLRDSEDVMAEALAALGGMANETERDALAMEIFGKSAMELNPLIKTSADEMERLTKEAHEIGAVMSDEAVEGLEGFGDELASLQAGLKGTAGELAFAFLPAFKGMVGSAKTYMTQFSDIVRGAGGDLGKVAEGVGQLLGQIATDIAAQAPQMMEAGLAIVQGILDAIIAALPALIPAAVGIITSLVQFLIGALPQLMDAGVQLLLALIQGILPQLPMLIETALQMIVTLAQGIAEALPQLMPVIAEIIPEIVVTLIKNLPMIIKAALQLIVALVDGLVQALPVLIAYVPEIITAIFNALIEALPMIARAAGELIAVLVLGIVAALPKLAEAALRVINAFTDGITGLMGSILKAGVAIVQGLWDGITSRYDWFKEQLRGWLKGIIDAILAGIGLGGNGGGGGGDAESEDDISPGPSFNPLSGLGDVEDSYNQAAGALAGAGVASTSVTVNFNVAEMSSDLDVYDTAYRIADVITRTLR